MSEAMELIRAERRRQVEVEGWTPEHDDEHAAGELAEAAACYVVDAGEHGDIVPDDWPWDARWWKPKDRRSDLIRAGALYLAEAERCERMGADAVALGFRYEAAKCAAALDAPSDETLERPAIRSTISPLVERFAGADWFDLAAVVADLADSDPWLYMTSDANAFCGACKLHRADGHDDGCLWVRACRLTTGDE